MKRSVIRCALGLVLMLAAGCATTGGQAGPDAPFMTKEELRELLGSPGLTVVDVRREDHWEQSYYKIRGAVRESPGDISWAPSHRKDGTLVLYCA